MYTREYERTHVRQSMSDAGLDFQAGVLETSQVVHSYPVCPNAGESGPGGVYIDAGLDFQAGVLETSQVVHSYRLSGRSP